MQISSSTFKKSEFEHKLYILNREKESNNINDLETLLDNVKATPYLGDIKWPEKFVKQLAPNDLRLGKIKEIEELLKENNRRFSRYPTDFLHGLLCLHLEDIDSW